MPQMAPMSWLLMMVVFSITFMIMNSINYFSFNYPPKLQELEKKKISISWKW
uniref:ATP synthase F0 subunit 8 n=1 Tax=Figulus punctatus TaxID=509906 RepID=UPI00286CDD9C|nr:ATP synthase F0 subunit 8 [Figulus punctatus]WKD83642.1 ATP synthase F0 subunit 8 [Figulus punctatus]